jgi:hypothetical protein
LDPTDVSLKAFIKSDSVPKAIFKLDEESQYLVCYADFGFYINKLGRRDNIEVVHYWVGPAIDFGKSVLN